MPTLNCDSSYIFTNNSVLGVLGVQKYFYGHERKSTLLIHSCDVHDIPLVYVYNPYVLPPVEIGTCFFRLLDICQIWRALDTI
jgi:hypothetical protein